MKRIYDKRIDALVKTIKSQDTRIRHLENTHKKYMEGDLNEILEINKQLYGNENRKKNQYSCQ